MESTTMVRLVHEHPDCGEWAGKYMHMVADGAYVHLRDKDNTDLGSWDGDEQANCPWCSENLYIELPDGETMSPQAFLNGKDN